MISKPLPPHLAATLDLLRRYGAVFTHAWRERCTILFGTSTTLPPLQGDGWGGDGEK